ncbi:MEMO1 family protein [Candidatus Uhrbacteria bacterium]|nr:MEMO1 family protein [Candidatus Uhrbacteria bacterium]
MLKYFAIVPHSPVLVPGIGKDSLQKLSQTVLSLKKIHAHIKEKSIETIVILAPDEQRKKHTHALSLYTAQNYEATFEEFGDLATKLTCAGDPVLADFIKRNRTDYRNVRDAGSPQLSYSASVPLVYLLKGFPAKVLVITPPDRSLTSLFEIGQQLQKALQESPRAIACIASGDFSRTIEDAGRSDELSAFPSLDQEFLTALKNDRLKKFFKMPLSHVQQAGACGIPICALFFGILDCMNVSQNILSYEAPLNVGQLVSEYLLP